jgi:hypothetical protein
MTTLHPLKRKSVKPSSSTVRGMLPIKQFRALDAAMQSLRAAGLRLDWQWRDREVGWVCAALRDEAIIGELQPTREPLVGQFILSKVQQKSILSSTTFPARFKPILEIPIFDKGPKLIYELELVTTPERDLFSELIEALSEVLAEAE